ALQLPKAQEMLANTCISYLSLDVFARECCDNKDELQLLSKENPLFQYAASHWGTHVYHSGGYMNSESLNIFLLDDKKTALAAQ
ncbi:hypothetical protein M422DRAFT_133634, partial [Sphaerobolus stellatus SS14]